MAKQHDTDPTPRPAPPARKVKNPDAVAIDRITEILEARPAANRARILRFVTETYAPEPEPETPY